MAHRQNLILRELSAKDESAFLAWVSDWDGDRLSWATFVWEPGMEHSEHLRKLEEQKQKTKLPANMVPSTMLYGFSGEHIVGRMNIRHELNESLTQRGGHLGYAVSPRFRKQGFATELFRQSIAACRKLGLNDILVTCGDQNHASWRIIEKFGGLLENTFDDRRTGEIVRRYWVNIASNQL
ncbi:MAG: GNAT family N-acetyltransferase [Bdellovibrionales bacterium]|jgi:predicted acetyltransferase|nr:GNAT family N-acetyltransferase [Bdellovibrionales bacterium]